jgi:hypothetical protein
VAVTVISERRGKKLNGLVKTETWKSIGQKGQGGRDVGATSRKQQQQNTLLKIVVNVEATLGD